ncbi:UDP-4-keto-6-deoxy-N-acetylglucosamine 4-aminotransferase [Clostridium argentinense CDC 2741]|uniref:UDP-4-keto-6-deoxy-N-acetylglucosamine 4-aminotransferase n=1 Tax=Clostridium argentinense CDC 2741 TaxID=1418104 RepID=A0A0C1U5N9_9CLOT|nr:UDP-4-amino-4,6-dideoxy-N-acetyl-beta-L-altrosamine transaminase [Clostridium argentinense]ARC85318.1 UDP-4-amino-4,6-dideoxy-N-acetyl-beta-L-altrosamine transaminase [Clostridium argentinense]KIE47048.1 UDP-4-keto-6-deoxy-N-acetylglucosamine 4-aminotransferase [Clostridium argentinense CDC 2741]NFF40941.1 UDP-4-amino-4,6-dideoxy-N-acetyl-beta-L-altrosamine transaminase [Clostridium argentinense]NFP51348.1 UDP-4-amino-4,6-dideoxy-N-acetyl-beta-L-altrosamine transaminase [Clostridium argentin
MNKFDINCKFPTRETYLSYGKQNIDEDDIQEVIKALKSDYLTTGPYVKIFEENIANYVGASYAVAFSNGTAALHGACFAAGIEEGDEVIVSPMTFAASSNAILYCGGIPIFCDIDMNTGNIDVSKIEEKITSKTKAIIPVDFAGHSVDMDEIIKIANKYNLIVIEDGAHALGSEYKNKKIGNGAHMTEFSFHPVKPITTGEGGIITTNDKELYNKLIRFRSHGITRDKSFLVNKNEGPWYYEQLELGFNYRLTDIGAALGVSQLKKLDKFIERRREIASIYNEAFKDIEEIETPIEYDYAKSGYHIYVIKLKLEKLCKTRKEIFMELQNNNIGANVHYIPVYYHPYYKELGYEKGLCKVAEKFYERIITLPLHPSMNNIQVQYIVNNFISTIKK